MKGVLPYISYMSKCRCEEYRVHGLATYTFFSTRETRPIKSNLARYTKNLIYTIQCNRFNLQCIGEMKRPLKDRFDEHREKYLRNHYVVRCVHDLEIISLFTSLGSNKQFQIIVMKSISIGQAVSILSTHNLLFAVIFQFLDSHRKQIPYRTISFLF